VRPPPRLVRRIVIAPAVPLAALALLASVPVWALAAVVASSWMPGRLRVLRLLGYAVVYLLVDSALLLAACLLWVASGFGWRLRRPGFRSAHYWLLGLALDVLVQAAVHAFRLDVEFHAGAGSPRDVDPQRGGPPLVVLSRHAGPGDSFLLAHVVLNRWRRRPRIVLKDSMQWEPGVDVLLHRVPSRFINPRPGAGEEVVASIGELAGGMGPDDALVLFPEGGNFTASRRTRAIAKLRAKGLLDDAAHAESLVHTLPPRPAGARAALAAAPDADVVFVAHTGLDDLSTLPAMWQGLPMDDDVDVRLWRVPAEEIPREEANQLDWLQSWWTTIDEWIAATRAAEAAARDQGGNG
jgi:Acyltransferase